MSDQSPTLDPNLWCFFGFGMSPLVLVDLVEEVGRRRPEIRWSVVLPTSHHRALIEGLESVSRLLVVEEGESAEIGSRLLRDYSDGKEFDWSVYRDLDSEKFVGNLRRRNERENELSEQTMLIRDFLGTLNPSLVLFPQPVETPLGLVVHREATRIGCEVAIPYHLRFWNRSFYSSSPREVPSEMSRIGQDSVDEVSLFLAQFRRGGTGVQRSEVSNVVLRRWPKYRRLLTFLRRVRRTKNARRLSALRVSLFSGWFPSIWKLIQRLRSFRNQRLFDLAPQDLDGMKFIFVPLQYTPESSINVPDPFFVDQLRMIDALRYSMPSDHFLVVKEHPAAIGVRKSRFIKSVMNLPGVRVVRWDTPAQDLIKAASLTATVTGTAAFEAFCLGRPSLVFAPTFFSDALGGPVPLNGLRTQLSERISAPPTDSVILRSLAEIWERSRPFISLAPESMSGLTLSKENTSSLVDSLLEFQSLTKLET